MTDELMSTKQVCELLGIKSEDTVRKLGAQGKLVKVPVGRQVRWTRASVEAYIRGESPAPTPVSAEPGTSLANIEHDPEIIQAEKTLRLQEIKTKTARQAWDERQLQMQIQGCKDCEAQKTANEALAQGLAEQQNDLTHKLEEYGAANLELQELKAEVKAERQALRADMKQKQDFELRFEASGSKWRKEQVEKELQALFTRFAGQVHGTAKDDEAWLHVKRLESLWLGKLRKEEVEQ